MKIYRISNSSVSVANVGASGTSGDENRCYMAASWLSKNDPVYSENITFSYDNINLIYGRDFLKENKRYDIVILHHIFNPIDRKDNGAGVFSISPLQSVENWTRRLLNTGADYIFSYGSYGEVSAGWLGDIPGYNCHIGHDGYEGVFRSQKLPDINVEINRTIDWDKVDVSWLNDLEDLDLNENIQNS